ncbi:MAG TPA: serine/threonine-protein kinase [Woeseiaceae bacterium]|nr:serine/threonine-protein kinase [Woeseiaceae bacterium]
MDSSRYTEKTYVGSGGMASVYKAFDQKLRRHVAIKEMAEQFRDNDEVRDLFLNEARKMALVRHQNVVQVYDIFEDEVPTIIMEYMSGASLATRAGTGTLPADIVLKIIRQIASGLRAIHDAGLVHRDIKPENILEENNNYKITDFGVAITGDEEALPFVTNKYAAPEVLVDPSKIGASSDIYSVGVLAAELLLGPRVFEEAVREAIERDADVQLPAIKNSVQAFWQQWVASDAELPPLNKINESIPEEVAQLIARIMRRDRKERIVDCRTLIKEIDKAIAATGERASAATEYSTKMKKRMDKTKAENAAPAVVKRKRPLWFKLLAGTLGLLVVAVAALILLPKGPAVYFFDVVTDPEGAAVFINGEPAEPGRSPTRVTASWGDVLTLQPDAGDAVELELVDSMPGLSVGEEAYQLDVTLVKPLSIESSAQAAAWLSDRIAAAWPVEVSIPGIPVDGRVRLPLGTKLTFDVNSAEAGSLWLIHFSADNYATIIYPAPNGFVPDLEANQNSNVGEELRLITREPLGQEWVLFIVAQGLPEPPVIDGVIPVDDTMRAYAIHGPGSPGQQLVVWLAGELASASAAALFLETEVVPAAAP